MTGTIIRMILVLSTLFGQGECIRIHHDASGDTFANKDQPVLRVPPLHTSNDEAPPDSQNNVQRNLGGGIPSNAAEHTPSRSGYIEVNCPLIILSCIVCILIWQQYKEVNNSNM